MERDPTATLEDVLAAYLRAVDRGESADPRPWLEAYPQYADDLQVFFDDHADLNAIGSPLQSSGSEKASGKDSAPTLLKPAVAVSRSARPSRDFGDYEIIEEIARGGMGVVFRARQRGLNRIVALKMVMGGQLASDDDIARFRTEAEAAASLDHPHIIPIYEVGQHAGQHFFSMKLIDGDNLAQRLQRGLPRPDEVARLLVAVAQAVHYAHQHGLLHRDLKPSNILLDGPIPYVTDFGLSKRLADDRGLTQTGAVLGTPSYMPPEQAMGEKALSVAADVYSLGAIMYEMLTGRKVFQAETPVATILMVKNDEPNRPRLLNRDIDPDLETICLKCLEKNPNNRYASAEAFASDLQAWLRHEPIEARPSGYFEQIVKTVKRRPTAAKSVAAIFAVVVASLAIVSWEWHLTAEENRAKQEALEVAEQRRREAEEALSQAGATLYLHRISQADRELRAGNVENAQSLLASCDEARRGWEWDYLDCLCRRFSWPALPTNLSEAAFSKDGRWLAVLDGKFNLTIWDRARGEVMARYQGTGALHSLRWAVENQRIAVVADGNRVLLWDFATEAQPKDTGIRTKGTVDIAMNGDGTLVATCLPHTILTLLQVDPRAPVTLWNLKDGRRKWHADYQAEICEFSPDGTKLAIATQTKELVILKTADGSEIARLKDLREGIAALSFTADGKGLLTADASGTLCVWDETLKKVRESPLPQAIVRSVECFADDRATVVCTQDNYDTVRVYQFKDNKSTELFKRRAVLFQKSAMCCDGPRGRVAWEGEGRRIRLWPVDDNARLWQAHERTVQALAFADDGLRSLGIDRVIKAWHLPEGTMRNRWDVRDWPVAMGNDGRYAAVDRGQLHWYSSQGRLAGSCPCRGKVATLTFASRGGDILVANDTTIRVCDTKSGQMVRESRLAGKAHLLSIAGWRDQYLAYSQEEPLFVDYGREGKAVPLPGLNMNVNVLRFNREGTLLAGSSFDNSIVCWDVARQEVLHTLRGHAAEIVDLSYHPDGNRLVSASLDGTVRLWDIVLGEEALSLRVREPHCVLFSPDGRTLVCGCEDGTIRAWPSVR